ncbi:MAG: alpha/beta hydrolase [Eggerthellaceae bacterium]|nr:alpha/beta hydrolase [Eggerthellaceae bacterium]
MTDVAIIPINFPSHDAKSTCKGQIWQAADLDGKPRGIIQFVHGMAEHITRYDDLARFFVDHGFIACGIDHIGHGDTAATKADWGVMPIEGGSQVLVDDAHELRLAIQQSYGEDVPYFMYGHSMGSFVTRLYISQHGAGLSGAILSGTGHNPVAVCKAGLILARRIAKSKGIRYQSKTLHNLADGAYSGAIKDARTKFDWLSHDDAVVDTYIADEASGFPFKAGGYATLMELCEKIAHQSCADKVPRDLPVLFIAGNEDPVGNNGKGVTAVYDMFRKANINDVTLTLYDGMRHEVHNEIDHEKVYNDVLRWIEDRMASPAE